MPVAEVLITAGLHVPVILFVDVVGNTGAVTCWHCAGIAAKVGVTWLVIVTLSVAVVAHWLAAGVNV